MALELARRYLRTAGDEASTDLASASNADLLRRLNVVNGEERLTNAGSLLFVETPQVAIDYIRREAPGGDSVTRVGSRHSLLEQVWEADQTSQSANRIVHMPEGFARGQLRAIPERALREAIVNGVVHRDWLSPEPTTVEHIGDTLTVTSPGGFIGGIDPANIITHPAVPRYRSLAEAMATLRLAEREGIGVDRMVRDMLAIGRPAPEIDEIAGPYVRVVLAGGDPDHETVSLLTSAEPQLVTTDVDALLCIAHLVHNGWIDVESAAPVIQRGRAETEAALTRLAATKSEGSPVIVPLDGVPAGNPIAYRLSDAARSHLRSRLAVLDAPAGRRSQLLSWARARGRVSSTEAADMTGLSVPTAGAVLTAMEEEGLLRPGRENKSGRGFFYVPGS